MCVLQKDCNVRNTKAGDVVVVIEHVAQSDNVQETLTLLIFEQSAATAANIVSRYYKRDGGIRQPKESQKITLFVAQRSVLSP